MAVTAITSWIMDDHNLQEKELGQTIWMLNVLLHIITYYCTLLHT